MSRRSQTSVTNKAVAARACHSGLGVIYVGGSSGGGRAAVGGLRVRFTCCAGKITGTRSRGSTFGRTGARRGGRTRPASVAIGVAGAMGSCGSVSGTGGRRTGGGPRGGKRGGGGGRGRGGAPRGAARRPGTGVPARPARR